jgi:MFS family permease
LLIGGAGYIIDVKLKTKLQKRGNRGSMQRYQEANSGFFYGYIIIVASFVAILAIYGTRYAFGIFFKPMMNEFGWTSAVTAGAFSLSAAMEGLLAIGMGWLTDKLGPRVVLTIAGVISAAGYLALYWTNSVWQFYLFFAILGIGAGSTFVPILTTIPRWFFQKRGTMAGVVLCGISLGTLIASPLSNWLISIFNWRTSFLILGGVVLVLTVSAAQFLRSDPAEKGLRPYGQDLHSRKTGSSAWGFTLREAAVTRQFWEILAIFFAFGFCALAIMVYIAPYAIDNKIPPATAASLVATVGGVSIVGRLTMGSLADRIGNKQCMLIGLAIMAAAVILLLFSSNIWMLYAFAVIFGFAYGSIGPSQSPAVVECFGLKHHGQVFGVVDIGFTLGAALGPFVFGFILDRTGSYQNVFICGILVCLAGVISAIILKPGQVKKVPQEDGTT